MTSRRIISLEAKTCSESFLKRMRRETGGNLDNTFKEFCHQEEQEGRPLVALGQEKCIFLNGKINICLYADGSNPLRGNGLKPTFTEKIKELTKRRQATRIPPFPPGIYLLKTPDHLSHKISHSQDVAYFHGIA